MNPVADDRIDSAAREIALGVLAEVTGARAWFRPGSDMAAAVLLRVRDACQRLYDDGKKAGAEEARAALGLVSVRTAVERAVCSKCWHIGGSKPLVNECPKGGGRHNYERRYV